ncbi:hypothetical protein VTN49DRAFT_1045 [Thermomyces lanuginosus]|uniref:uncharacterized protein n=1 Tax=Thermomyces lanuginosus TaxID=5541 RepID=UPI0037422470
MSVVHRYSDDPLDHASREVGAEGIKWDEAERVPEGIPRFVQFPQSQYVAKWYLYDRHSGVVEGGQSQALRSLHGSLSFEIQVYQPMDVQYRRQIRFDRKIMVIVELSVVKYRDSPAAEFKDVPQDMNVAVGCRVDQHASFYSLGIEKHTFNDGWAYPPACYVKVRNLMIDGAKPGYEYIISGHIWLPNYYRTPPPQAELPALGVWYDTSSSSPKGLYCRKLKGIQ